MSLLCSGNLTSEQLLQYEQFMKDIEKFWLENCNQEADPRLEHLDINRVMLATSLVPDGFFGR